MTEPGEFGGSRERRMQNEAIAIEVAVATDGADCT